MASGRWFFLGVLCFFSLASPAVQECKEEYRLRRPTHTACRPPNKNCKIAKRGVSPSDRLLILKIHNDFRSMVALGKLKGFPAAADMRKLEWDAELASVAQALAEQCTGSEGESDHDNYRDRFTIRFPNTGQNLAFRGRNFPFQKNDWSGRVREWFIEHADFSPERRQSFRVLAQDRRKPTGHFTQLVWAETGYVGCGFVEYSVVNATRLPYMQYYVCNYAVTGNVFKRPLYREGEPCTACPAGTVCDKAVGLCSLEGEKEHSQLGKDHEKSERAEPNAAAVFELLWRDAFCMVATAALATLRGQRATFFYL